MNDDPVIDAATWSRLNPLLDAALDLPPRERDIAMVFQDYALYPHKNVYENLAFGLRLRKFPAADIDRRVKEAAAILKIEHLLERKPRALSGGQC